MVFDRLWMFSIGRRVQLATPTSVDAHSANWNQSRAEIQSYCVYFRQQAQNEPHSKWKSHIILVSAVLSQYTHVTEYRQMLHCVQGRNHVFKVGCPIPWSRALLPFYRKNRQVYPVWCSRLHNHTLFIKKLCKSWGSVQILGKSGPPPTLQCLRP